jgi:hypothetical protein
VDRTVVDLGEGGELGLDVGGRLLVRVLKSPESEVAAAALPGTVARLRDERDRRGFRRLRLVLVHPDPAAARGLIEDVMASNDLEDDRVYLHFIAPGELPPQLAAFVSG